MNKYMVAVLSLMGLVTLSGCATRGGVECEGDVCEREGQPEVTQVADAATKAALFDRVAKLEGEWVVELTPEEIAQYGPPATSVIKVTSSGSIVRDIMFVGTPHEMTNVYHMDGDELVMVHYCAQGNQPRMEAKLNDGHQHAANQIHFQFDEVSNLTSADQSYMGDVVLTFVDDNHYTQSWTHFKAGKAEAGPVIKWKRK
jgi:hypothetical protein